MNGLDFSTDLSIVQDVLAFPTRYFLIPFSLPILALISLAIPSVLQSSGLLVSLTSIESLSPSLPSISPFTYINASSSPSSENVFPTSFSKSLLLTSSVGISLTHHPAFPQPIQVIAEQIPYVLYAKLEHCKPVNAHSPCNCWFFNSKCMHHFWPENSCAGKLNPAELRVLCRKLH